MEHHSQTERFFEMLQEEIKTKAEKSSEVIEKLQTKNISYRYITSDLGDITPQILVNETYFNDEISLTVEFRGRNILLTLERIDMESFDVVQSVKMQSEDAASIVNQIEALTLIYKIGYHEGKGLDFASSFSV